MNSSPVADPKSLLRVSWVLGGGLFLAGFAQFRVHVTDREHTLALAKARHRLTTVRTIAPTRGRILASDGQPLAQDLRSGQLTIDFTKVPRSRAFLTELAAASGIPAAEFEGLAESGAKKKTWLAPLDGPTQERIDEVRVAWRADGVSVRSDGKRAYPFGPSTACLVGLRRTLKGKDGKPAEVMTGLEASFDKELSGVPGRREGMTDRTGAFLVSRLVGEQRPKVDGKDVVLTIDTTIQNVAYEALSHAVDDYKGLNGAAVAIDPKTGDILAMASYPSFHPEAPDPTDRNPGGYNPAIMSALEPGSTFKILTLAKALDAGKASMSEVISCGGQISVGNRAIIRCDMHGGRRAHGPVDPIKAIAKSCNVSAATWAKRVGRTEFFRFIDEVGLVDKPGTGLRGEARGLLNRNDFAQHLQLANLGFGQAINTTPTALASAFSLVANGGVRMKPRLIKSIGGKETPIEPAGPAVIRKETADEVLRAMEAVIESSEGTGKHLTIPGYRLGGKTGTAQKLDKGRNHVLNFVGTVPSRDPKALILVMVDSPRGGQYGGQVAGPVFRAMAQAIIRRYRIPPTEPVEVARTR